MSLKDTGMNSLGAFFSHSCCMIFHLYKITIISGVTVNISGVCDTPIPNKCSELTLFIYLYLCPNVPSSSGYSDDDDDDGVQIQMSGTSHESIWQASGSASILLNPHNLYASPSGDSNQIRSRNHSSAPMKEVKNSWDSLDSIRSHQK